MSFGRALVANAKVVITLRVCQAALYRAGSNRSTPHSKGGDGRGTCLRLAGAGGRKGQNSSSREPAETARRMRFCGLPFNPADRARAEGAGLLGAVE